MTERISTEDSNLPMVQSNRSSTCRPLIRSNARKSCTRINPRIPPPSSERSRQPCGPQGQDLSVLDGVSVTAESPPSCSGSHVCAVDGAHCWVSCKLDATEEERDMDRGETEGLRDRPDEYCTGGGGSGGDSASSLRKSSSQTHSREMNGQSVDAGMEFGWSDDVGGWVSSVQAQK